MTISVVIATYNRAARLDECLRRVGSQAFGPGDGILVADNGSSDATPAVLAAWIDRLPGVLRVVVERRPGKSVAIATALRGCRADVLAFTDDDVAVADDWLASIREAFARDPDVALVGGPVVPDYEAAVPGWLDLRGDGEGFGRMASPLGLLDYGPRRQALGPRAILGANLAVRRAPFESVGGFPSALGKLRGTLLSGEDHQLCERLQAAGYAAVYDPSVSVRHAVPPDRLRWGYFRRWFFWSGVTHAVMDRGRPRDHGRRVLGVPAYLAKQFAVEALATPASLLGGARRAAAEHSTRAAFAAGYAWATWRGRPVPPVAPDARARVEAA